MKLRNTIMGIAFSVLLVGAIVGVIVGVTTHEEPGFIDDVPTWVLGEFPLDVSVARYTVASPLHLDTADDDDKEMVAAAVERANDRLGFDAFVFPARERHVSRIDINLGIPAEPGWRDPGGHSEIQHRGNVAEVCYVTTSNTAGNGDLTVQVLIHELGHCLGLAHGDRSGIMQEVTSPTAWGHLPASYTDHDVRILRERYGPR